MLGKDFLIEQGMCCGSGCFLCPYIPKHVAGSKRIRMEKYKNKDGIELSYTGNDSHQVLVKEVIGEAIKLLDFPPSYKGCEKSMNKCKEFLRVNFNIEENE
jgi:hypothetical protein